MQQRSKVLLALSLALILVFALGSVALADDYSNHWSAEFSTKAINNGWITRDANGNIQPDALATRAEYVMMLWRALGQPAPKSACPFTDIPEDATYRNAATAMYEAGVTTGTTATTFGPDLNLTREMAFTMLARAYSLTPSNTLTYQQFTDHATISEYARNAVSVLFEKGYITGVGANTCAPKQNLKRGEMIKIVIGVYDGVQSATAATQQAAAALLLVQAQNSSTLSLSLTVSFTNSREATIAITASDKNDGLNYIGWVKCKKGDDFTSNKDFTSLGSNATSLTVEDKDTMGNSWYAICATNKNGGFIFKTVEISNIIKDSPKFTLSTPKVNSDGDYEITLSSIASGSSILGYFGPEKSQTSLTSSDKSKFKNSSDIKSNVLTVSKTGWYAVGIEDNSSSKVLGYVWVEVTDSTYKLTLDYVNTQDSSYGSISGGGTYSKNAEVTATASPKTGVSFVGWYSTSSGSGTAVSTKATYEFDITKDTTLYAKFSGTPTTVAVTGVTLNKTTLSLTAGGTETLTATVAPTTATTQTVTWSSSDTSKATVSTSGLVTAVAAGTATITVTTTDGSKTASCAVTVAAVPATVAVTGVTLNETSKTLEVNNTLQLTATVAPANASNKTVTWTSSDTSKATVSTSGLVTAVAAGTATITVTTTDGSKTASCAVTVTVPATVLVTGVTLSPSTAQPITVGDTITFTVTVAPGNATNTGFDLVISDDDVLEFSGPREVKAKAAGTATIMVTTTDGNFTDTCEVTVTP